MSYYSDNHSSTIAAGPNIKQIPRVSCSNPEEFEQRLVEQREPLIITDLLTQWPAFSKWTPEFFKEKYGGTMSRVVINMPSTGVSYGLDAQDFIRDMRLSDFIDFMRHAEQPCYYRRQHSAKLPGVEDDCDFVRLTPNEKAATNYVWIGSGGTRTNLHFDMQDVVLCQFYGSKNIWLVESKDSKYVYPYVHSLTKSQVVPDSPDLDKHPLFRNATILQGSLNAGEALFIPYGCWHSIISASTSISLSHEFGRKITWPGIFRAINTGGLASWLTVTRDFVRYGLLGGKFTRKFADDPPFGRLVYEMFQESLARHLP